MINITPFDDLPIVEQIKRFLDSTDSFHVNMYMIQEHGLKNAVYLSYLADYYEQEWTAFPFMKDQITDVNIKASEIRKCKKYLTEQKIIEIKFKENPPRQYYKINPLRLTW